MVRDRGFHHFTFVGSWLGLAAFLFFGLIPSLVYGGFAGTTLAAGLMGHPIDAGLFPRLIIIFGMLVGMLATAAVFTVAGAAVGAGVHSMSKWFVNRILA